MAAPNIGGVPTITFQVPPTTGNIYYVSSVTGNTAYAGTPDAPKATLAQAYALCVASHGDIVVLLPGHAETLTGTTTLNKAGVQIMGFGDRSIQPRLTWGAANATVAMSANANSISGIWGAPGVDGVTAAFTCSAVDCSIQIEWEDATDVETQRVVLTTNACEHLRVDLEYHGYTGGDNCVAPIQIVGGKNHELVVDFFGLCSTAIVNVITTPTANLQCNLKNGYVQGITNQSRLLVDTITGSTWALWGFDGAAGYQVTGSSGKAIAVADPSVVVSDLVVPTADVATNAYERDVIGNKEDARQLAIATDKSLMAYAKGLITMGTVAGLDSTGNAYAGDVIGNKEDAAVMAAGTQKSVVAYAKGILTTTTAPAADATTTAYVSQVVGHKEDAAVYLVGTQKSVIGYLKGILGTQDQWTVTGAAFLTNGTVPFTVAGGPIEVLALASVCQVGADATAATIQYAATATGLSQVTISNASGSVANAAVNATVALQGTALNTAALYAANGTNLIATPGGTILVLPGTIDLVIGSGPTTTGTWKHYLKWRPLGPGVTVTAGW